MKSADLHVTLLVGILTLWYMWAKPFNTLLGIPAWYFQAGVFIVAWIMYSYDHLAYVGRLNTYWWQWMIWSYLLYVLPDVGQDTFMLMVLASVWVDLLYVTMKKVDIYETGYCRRVSVDIPHK